MSNKAYNKWRNLLDSKIEHYNAPFTDNEIIYFRKAVGESGLKDRDLRYQLLNHFNEIMPADGFNITQEHKRRGIDYLRSKTYKLNGSLRKNNIFGTFERRVIDNYVDFKLVGIENYSENSYEFYLPIFRCISSDGSYFDYTGTVYSMIKVLDTHSINGQLLNII